MRKWPLALLLLSAPALAQDAPVLTVTDGDNPIATVTLPVPASGAYTVSIRYPGPGSRPHPKPAPTPGPPAPVPPAPAPVPAFTGHLHATLLHAIDEPSTALLRVSPIKADLAALGCDWAWRDPSSADFARFVPRMRQDKLLDDAGNLKAPVCYVTDDLGTVKAIIPAPTAEADVLSRISIIRGLGR